jgi:hypothetical protein
VRALGEFALAHRSEKLFEQQFSGCYRLAMENAAD